MKYPEVLNKSILGYNWTSRPARKYSDDTLVPEKGKYLPPSDDSLGFL